MGAAFFASKFAQDSRGSAGAIIAQGMAGGEPAQEVTVRSAPE
jgi:hypothetical protein